jgi:hypothetical protein
MSNHLKKYRITKVVQEALPADSGFKNTNLEKLVFAWWATGRSGESLRITDVGRQAFDAANLEYYDFDIDSKSIKIKAAEFTLLLNKIKCPFFIGIKNNSSKSAYIRMYDSKIAMVVTLYGSFKDYLEALK